MNILLDIGVTVIAATIFAYVARLLKQPLILAYIVAGVAIGPIGLRLITSPEVVASLSELGIAFLLFMVGLEIDLRKMFDVGRAGLITGLIQVTSSFLLGFLAMLAFGFSAQASFFGGIITCFSSTMIIVKLLSDKNEVETIRGRMVIAVLLVQDLLAILVLVVLSNIGSSQASMGLALMKGVVLISATYLLSELILPVLFKFSARSQELLFLSSIAWCLIMTNLATLAGYSIAIGAFLAGLAIAHLSYNLEIAGKVRSLRDFFSTIFFVSLGMQIAFTSIGGNLLLVSIIAAIILIWNPLTTMLSMSFLGYQKKISFLTGICLVQVSEFSLIIVAMGASTGKIPSSLVSMTALLAVATITATSYLIKYDSIIYEKMEPVLSFLDMLSSSKKEIGYRRDESPKAILCGYNRIGFSVLRKIRAMGSKVLVVDINPARIRYLAAHRIPCIYGDIGDQKIIDKLGLKGIETLISTVPDLRANQFLIQKTREVNKNAVVIATATQSDEALELYKKGADYVILPHMIGGEHACMVLDQVSAKSRATSMPKLRESHIKELHHRLAMEGISIA